MIEISLFFSLNALKKTNCKILAIFCVLNFEIFNQIRPKEFFLKKLTFLQYFDQKSKFGKFFDINFLNMYNKKCKILAIFCSLKYQNMVKRKSNKILKIEQNFYDKK